MAATNLTIEVQEYLDKHKINALFEDMREKLIKNLPSDPISYLINVLKSIQERKRRAVSSRDSTSSSRGGATGRAVRPVSTDKLAKSSDNIRPHSTSTPKRLPLQSAPAVTARSGSKLKAPETPTTPKAGSTTTPKVTSSTTPRTTKDTSRSLKDTPRPSKTSTPRIAKTSTGSSKPSSTTRPSTVPTNGQTKTTRSTRSHPSSSTSRITPKPTTSKTSPTKTSPTKTTPTKTTPSKPSSGTAKRVLKPTTPTAPTSTVKASEETIDEFFGEKKKSSSKQLLISDQEEMAELEGKNKPSVDEETELDGKDKPSVDEETELEGKDKPSVDEETELEGKDDPSVDEETELEGKDKPSSEEAGMVSTETPNEDTTIIDAYLQKKKTQNKDAARSEHLETLQDMILTDQKPADCSNHDNDEDDEDEQPVALLEDIQVLQEEEGVGTIKSQDDHIEEVTKKQIDTEHRTMTMGDMAAMTAEEDFESASQITSQGNFPSWDASATVTEQSNDDSQKTSNYDDNDSTAASTATTATSKDEWVGLTQACPPPISDSESEVQVPMVPLSGKSWTPPPTHDSQKTSNYDDDNDSTAASTATTATSKDDWAGLTQACPPPISDSESEVQVPKVPLSGKSWTPPPTHESDDPPPVHESDDPSTAQQWAT